MKTQHFTILKKLILTEELFSDSFDYFFNNFGEDQSFYDMGTPSVNTLLPIILKIAGKNYFGANAQVTNYRMTEISEFNFIHGTCFIDDKLTMVIFFTDIKMGLASMSMGGATYKFVHLKAKENLDGQPFSTLAQKKTSLN